jgi:hypothetical protein
MECAKFFQPFNVLSFESLHFSWFSQNHSTFGVCGHIFCAYVVDCLWAMSLAPHSYISTKFDGDVFFELPLVDILEGHYG